MSKAGIYSNRGDGYQTLVALDRALSILEGADYEWIEIDSVNWTVDDVVVGKGDRPLICCQCKKNQPDFTAWSIADLGDEIAKAVQLMSVAAEPSIWFYSRSPFGELTKLKEYSISQPNEESYKNGLGRALAKADGQLTQTIGSPAISTYAFLQRVQFEVSPDVGRLEERLRIRLGSIATNAAAAYDALWRRLITLGARMGEGHNTSVQHRLSKEDLESVLHDAGALIVPRISFSDVKNAFTSVSSIGRSWRRDILGRRLENPVVSQTLKQIEKRSKSILITGIPGAGKTCAMLELQEELEKKARTHTDLVPIFLQSREFADFSTVQERVSLGLPEQWTDKVARLADETHVVVVIDSLDVLSIAREHSVLTYFLAQIDRLLLIPNVTVVTACREFDRHYDRRIAERTWDKVLTCGLLDWETVVEPFLTELGIEVAGVDKETRTLIQNPRELALFIELAQREGGFSIVTSQALAQKYLDTIIEADDSLGVSVLVAIEQVAEEMLKTRSLSIPRQRLSASREMERALFSHNILRQTDDGKLTFGHQTLVDVLIISGAIRRGTTLSQFIAGLPPVPFVRPSIRGFVTQLSAGDRVQLRRQLRAVLTGNYAFHIRRLVAESVAELKPLNEDWPLVRDLRTSHREIFQIIYSQANTIEWHLFWFKHLVPILRDTRSIDDFTMHVHRVSSWKNEDPTGIIGFWGEALKTEWIDRVRIANNIAMSLGDFDVQYLHLVSPLVNELLKMPRQEHSFLGKAIAKCIDAGAFDDEVLWRYIAGDITDSDLLDHELGDKLHCGLHEFGDRNDGFLEKRMGSSIRLLNLAVESVEVWSKKRIAKKGYWVAGHYGFLGHSSYEIVRNGVDFRAIDNERLLFDAIEDAVFLHCRQNTTWWKSNRERLSFNHEMVMRYFAIVACTQWPTANLNIVAKILCDKDLLEANLSYEVGNLIQSAYIFLSEDVQEDITQTILNLWTNELEDEKNRTWIAYSRAQFISAIPCYLRSPEAQEILSEMEKKRGPIDRMPDRSRGGMIQSPFSDDVLLQNSDFGVLQLLTHYTGYTRDIGVDLHLGGEREVGSVLKKASSRDPLRFLGLLSKYWNLISPRYCDDIVEGISQHLSYRFGDLQKDDNWHPVEEVSSGTLLNLLLEELERHPIHWHHSRAASNALNACAHVVENVHQAERLVFLTFGYFDMKEDNPISGERVDHVGQGINMVTGHIVESLMILKNRLEDKNIQRPITLASALRYFARQENPALRALILRRLAYLQYRDPELGWELFRSAMNPADEGMWRIAEPCLYHSYRNNFEKVKVWLDVLRDQGREDDLRTWGRISALSAFSNLLDFQEIFRDLAEINNTNAWHGVAEVWSHPENFKQFKSQCLAGIEAGLHIDNPFKSVVARKVIHLFRDKAPVVIVSNDIVRRCFEILEGEDKNKRGDVFGFHAWLNAVVHVDPDEALAVTETYLNYVARTNPYLYDHDNNLTQLLTRLFAEAEEREEADDGVMLRRVVALQDQMLRLGVDGINQWLTAAERA